MQHRIVDQDPSERAMENMEALKHIVSISVKRIHDLEEFAELVLSTTQNETLKWNGRKLLGKDENDDLQSNLYNSQ